MNRTPYLISPIARRVASAPLRTLLVRNPILLKMFSSIRRAMGLSSAIRHCTAPLELEWTGGPDPGADSARSTKEGGSPSGVVDVGGKGASRSRDDEGPKLLSEAVLSFATMGTPPMGCDALRSGTAEGVAEVSRFGMEDTMEVSLLSTSGT